MWKLSAELRQRLDGQKGDNSPPLPMNCFVTVRWTLNSDDEETTRRCYSTFGRPVIMNGKFYSGNEGLLSFNEESDREFIMNEDNLIYGASCGFRVFDSEGLIHRIVMTANKRQDFLPHFVEAWIHFSDDAKEIESLLYGKMLFGGHVTRIELQKDANGRRIAKVWGGHAGVVVSKTRHNTGTAASVLGRPIISKITHVSKLFRERTTAK